MVPYFTNFGHFEVVWFAFYGTQMKISAW